MARRRSLAVLTAALAAACLGPTDEFGDQIHEDAKQRWAQTGPPSYSYVLTRFCVCPVTNEPIRVEVRDLVIVSRTYVSTDAPLEPQHYDDFPDIPGLFDLVDTARKSDPYYFSSSYDQTYGFPANVIINITPSSANDDLQITAVEFTPLT